MVELMEECRALLLREHALQAHLDKEGDHRDGPHAELPTRTHERVGDHWKHGGVHAILVIQAGNVGVRHGLGNEHDADGEAGNDVRLELGQVHLRQPADHREEREEKLLHEEQQLAARAVVLRNARRVRNRRIRLSVRVTDGHEGSLLAVPASGNGGRLLDAQPRHVDRRVRIDDDGAQQPLHRLVPARCALHLHLSLVCIGERRRRVLGTDLVLG